jgi:hypothetical protein
LACYRAAVSESGNTLRRKGTLLIRKGAMGDKKGGGGKKRGGGDSNLAERDTYLAALMRLGAVQARKEAVSRAGRGGVDTAGSDPKPEPLKPKPETRNPKP